MKKNIVTMVLAIFVMALMFAGCASKAKQAAPAKMIPIAPAVSTPKVPATIEKLAAKAEKPAASKTASAPVQMMQTPKAASSSKPATTSFKPPVILTSKMDLSTSFSVAKTIMSSVIDAYVNAPRLTVDEMTSKAMSEKADQDSSASLSYNDDGTTRTTTSGDEPDKNNWKAFKFIGVLLITLILQRLYARYVGKKLPAKAEAPVTPDGDADLDEIENDTGKP